MAFFGTMWAGIGIAGLQGWGLPWLLILSLSIGILLLVSGIVLLRQSSGLSNEMTESDIRRGKRMGMWFGIIFGLEGGLIATASVICESTNHSDSFIPIMGLIVGAHFIPLAPLFRVRIHYITGTLLCLLSAITLLALPVEATWGAHSIKEGWVVLGFGSALILWGTGSAVWLTGRRMLDRAAPGE